MHRRLSQSSMADESSWSCHWNHFLRHCVSQSWEAIPCIYQHLLSPSNPRDKSEKRTLSILLAPRNLLCLWRRICHLCSSSGTSLPYEEQRWTVHYHRPESIQGTAADPSAFEAAAGQEAYYGQESTALMCFRCTQTENSDSNLSLLWSIHWRTCSQRSIAWKAQLAIACPQRSRLQTNFNSL